ncbi:hypothetical protein GCWU000324_01058 [Kingella oralis ATCC 51147]|uniref:Uncharacterized protein n=1 Tax=Kingella oralis ATCC 51147 TaxID=629741 RepID=C4GFZ1_9NEIS|nr:hypothetical protein GCWU000324_01058 [Kingella oralis ATCC 51147]
MKKYCKIFKIQFLTIFRLPYILASLRRLPQTHPQQGNKQHGPYHR